MSGQPTVESVVFVIDDDASVRASLKSLFESVGFRVQLYGSADEFLQSERPDVPCCLVLDVRLPGLSGLEFQSELAKMGTELPIIFMTGHGDIPMTVQAMKAGAVEFLTKPCRDQELLDAVRLAIEGHRVRHKEEKHIAVLRNHFASLTAREKEVVRLVTAGLLNKQIAAELDISEVTVKMHRGNIMRKMQARSLADLARMADLLGIARPGPVATQTKVHFPLDLRLATLDTAHEPKTTT
jgi:FixJ family two-component response regulator